MTAARPAAAEALLKAREAAAAELRLPITDLRVIRLGALQLAYDACQARLVTGQAFDLGDLLRLDAALQELHAQCKAITDTPKVELRIVDGYCLRCQAEIPEDQRYHPIPTSPKPPPKTIDGEVVKPAAPKRKALPAPAAPAEKPHPPGIHEQNGARMQVLDYSAINLWP